jgi:hypothetical protein
VKLLDGIYIHRVSCGFAHTLLLAKCDTPEEMARIKKLPSFKPDTGL